MRGALAIGAVLVVLTAVAGCGGGDSETTESPTTGVPLTDGKCKADPAAEARREAEVKSGALSGRAAEIAKTTEVRTCEVEGNAIQMKRELCAHDPVDLLREEKISESQAEQLQDFQKRADC